MCLIVHCGGLRAETFLGVLCIMCEFFCVYLCVCLCVWVRGIYEGLKSPAISFEMCAYVHLLHDNWPPLYRLGTMNVSVFFGRPSSLSCLCFYLSWRYTSNFVRSASPSHLLSFFCYLGFLLVSLKRSATFSWPSDLPTHPLQFYIKICKHANMHVYIHNFKWF